MYQINPSLTWRQNLIAMINSGAPREVFTGDEFTVGPATPYVPQEPEEGTNTTVTVTAVPGSGYLGEQRPRYRRLTVGNTKPGAPDSYLVDASQSLQEIIQQISTDHQLLADEVVFTGMLELPAPGESAKLTCTAKPLSYFYVGNFDFTIAVPAQ